MYICKNKKLLVITFISHISQAEESATGNKADVSIGNIVTINGATASSSLAHGNRETNEKIYRLTIQIDKIRSKPGPRCKKPVPLILFNYLATSKDGGENETAEKTQPLQTSIVKKTCPMGSCKLRKCTYDSKPAFQCDICNKYYIVKREGSQEKRINTCSICSMIFADPQSLHIHVRKHLICDMCQTECSSQIMYDKHVRLHVSTDPSNPYKCHQCAKVFELKEGVKQHCMMEHPKIRLVQITSPTMTTKIAQQGDYYCASCNITFRNDQVYK